MYDKSESRMFQGVDKEDVAPFICTFWVKQDFSVDQISENQICGVSNKQRGLLKEEFFVWLNNRDDYLFIDLTMRVQKDDDWDVHRTTDYALMSPAVLGVGKITEYSIYKRNFKKQMKKFWKYMDQIIGQW